MHSFCLFIFHLRRPPKGVSSNRWKWHECFTWESNVKCRKIKNWINASLVKAIWARDKLCKRLLRQPFNFELRHQYFTSQNSVHNLIRRTKFEYYNNTILKTSGNAKQFWTILNAIADRPICRARFPIERFVQNGKAATLEQVKHVADTY